MQEAALSIKYSTQTLAIIYTVTVHLITTVGPYQDHPPPLFLAANPEDVVIL